MGAKDTFSLTWCEKHRNWWVTNCPDCMVDDNEEQIKREGRREVVEWIHVWHRDVELMAEWQAQKKDWGV